MNFFYFLIVISLFSMDTYVFFSRPAPGRGEAPGDVACVTPETARALYGSGSVVPATDAQIDRYKKKVEAERSAETEIDDLGLLETENTALKLRLASLEREVAELRAAANPVKKAKE